MPAPEEEVVASQREIYRGRLDNLPDNTSNIVRIFLSSTFTDTINERNILLDKAYPELRQFCAQNGLDFQVVDMRWGVRDVMTSDHQTTEICLQEIYNCQRLSVGPNFCVILGGRYGSRPLPARIKASVLQTIKQFAKAAELPLATIEEWYMLDTNAVPPEYTLKPITDIFPSYIDDNPANEELRKKAKNDWWKVQCEIQAIFRTTSQRALKQKHMTFEEWQQFNISVTEEEVKRGLLNVCATSENKCIVITREIDNVDFTDEKAYRYVDMNDNKDALDEETVELLGELRDETIPKHIADSEIQKYKLQWEKNGINPMVPAHAKYLEDFCKFFTSRVRDMIVKALEKRDKAASNWLFSEVLHHLNMCARRSRSFNCRHQGQKRVDEYLNDDTNRAPFVIHGVSGIGKTSFIAKLTRNAIEKHGKDEVVVVRFLGTSPKSTLITDTLQAVCLQICEAVGYPVPSRPTLNDINSMVPYLQEMFRKLSGEGHRVILFLDSLDQLSPKEGAYSLNWFPFNLPKGIKIVISVLTGYEGILDRCVLCIDNPNNILELGFLDDAECTDILETSLRQINRSITKTQMEILENLFENCKSPIFLKLAIEEAKNWRSYSNVDDITLGNTIQDGIMLLFDRLEKKHGQLFINAMAYIAAARQGVTDLEMDNLLSSSNEVLDDVYQYFSPPVKDLVRIPPLLWTRLRQDINEYLMERQADGKTVLALYHRQFIEVARQRYLCDEMKQKIHSELADMFLGVWSNGRKKELYLTKRKETFFADRKVEPQPLFYEGGYYNMRKLNELPLHLLKSGRHEELVDVCFGNFEWIVTKVTAMNILEVIRDIDMVISDTGEEEFKVLRDALRLIKPTLEYHPTETLAPEIIGRLLIKVDEYPKIIGKLVSQAIQWCENAKQDLLIPTVPCFISPGGVLRTTLVGHQQAINDAAINEDCSLLVTASSDRIAKLWDLRDDIVIQNLFHPGSVESCVMSSNAIVTSCDDTVYVWDMGTSKLRHTIPLKRPHSPSSETANALTNKPKMAALSNGNIVYPIEDTIFMVNIDEGKVIKEKTHGNKAIVSYLSVHQKEHILIGYNNGSVEYSNIAGSGEDVTYDIQRYEITGLDMAVKSGIIASVSFEDSIVIYNIKRGKVIQHIEPTKSKTMFSVALSPDGQLVAVGSIKDVRVWATESGQMLHVFLGHTGIVNSVCFTGYSGESQTNGPTLISAASDCTIKVWDLGKSELKSTYSGMTGSVTKLMVNDEYDVAVSASNESPYVKIWHLNPNLKDVVPEFQNDTDMKPVVFPDGKHVVTLDTDNVTFMVYDMKKSRKISTTLAHDAQITCMVCTPNGSHLITGGADNAVNVWQMVGTSFKRTLAFEFESEVTHIATHPDRKLFVVALNGNKVRLCHLQKFECDDVEINLKDEDITALEMSDDLILYGTDTGKIYAWNFESMSCLAYTYQEHTTEITILKVHNNFVASTTRNDLNIKIWDLKRRQVVQTLLVCKETVSSRMTITAMSFLHNGQLLGVGCYERLVYLYDMAKCRSLVPDGQYVYSPVTNICSSQEQNILVATQNGILSSYKPHITTDITMQNTRLTQSVSTHNKKQITTKDAKNVRKVRYSENVSVHEHDHNSNDTQKEQTTGRVVPNKELYRRAQFIQQARYRNSSQMCLVM
ncbi:unnamed protein product [Owenia fusiformis]|uniref:Uncharacterized protein n=1 Tax=Owenia fusiformis TaxID=6347 RepID=A0A8S4Q9C9_OWEFU|nr:unnamed protein product [Owenia fusiformis]